MNKIGDLTVLDITLTPMITSPKARTCKNCPGRVAVPMDEVVQIGIHFTECHDWKCAALVLDIAYQ